jgi:hypothetical protein
MRKPDGSWMGFSGNRSGASGGYIWPYGYTFANALPNLDGTYPLLPIVLHSDEGNSGVYPNITIVNPNIWGELDGVLAVTGHANASENIITVGRTDYLVVQNINRTTKTDFFAVKLA